MFQTKRLNFFFETFDSTYRTYSLESFEQDTLYATLFHCVYRSMVRKEADFTRGTGIVHGTRVNRGIFPYRVVMSLRNTFVSHCTLASMFLKQG